MGNLRKFKFRYKPFIPFHERNQITHFKLLLKYEKEDKENYHLYQNPIEQELVLIRFILGLFVQIPEKFFRVKKLDCEQVFLTMLRKRAIFYQ